MRISIPSECIYCVFNYDTISCNLGEFLDGYGKTTDKGKPEHCKVKHIEIIMEEK